MEKEIPNGEEEDVFEQCLPHVKRVRDGEFTYNIRSHTVFTANDISHNDKTLRSIEQRELNGRILKGSESHYISGAKIISCVNGKSKESMRDKLTQKIFRKTAERLFTSVTPEKLCFEKNFAEHSQPGISDDVTAPHSSGGVPSPCASLVAIPTHPLVDVTSPHTVRDVSLSHTTPRNSRKTLDEENLDLFDSSTRRSARAASIPSFKFCLNSSPTSDTFLNAYYIFILHRKTS